MANKIRTQSKEFVMYGTNSKGLAYLYGYPIKSVLLHTDKVNDKETFIFIARRRNIFWGVMEIIGSKIFGTKKPHLLTDKKALQNKILNENG